MLGVVVSLGVERLGAFAIVSGSSFIFAFIIFCVSAIFIAILCVHNLQVSLLSKLLCTFSRLGPPP